MRRLVKARPPRLPLQLAALILVSAGAGAALQPPFAPLLLNVATHARAMRPGEVVLFTVRPSGPLVELRGEAFERELVFWRSGDSPEWRALLGVPLDTPPGSYRALLHATSGNGAEATTRVGLRIAPARFATRRIRVDESFVNPPAEVAERMVRESQELAGVFANPTGVRLWRGPFSLPVPGKATSGFGRLTVMNGTPRGRHQGADLQAAEGTPVLAPNAGDVVLAAEYYVAGNVVVLDHGGGLFSLFAHLSRIAVEAGSRVSRGDRLGDAGATGRVTGPHLHWSVRLLGTSVDPLSLVTAVAHLDDGGSAARR